MTQAYHASLAAGTRVWVVGDGAIYEVSPDGRRTYIKDVEPSTPVEPGTTRVFLGARIRLGYGCSPGRTGPARALISPELLGGYRTYLYYISTSDPSINVSRVRDRVRMGGDPVPEEKIRTRARHNLVVPERHLIPFVHGGNSSGSVWDSMISRCKADG